MDFSKDIQKGFMVGMYAAVKEAKQAKMMQGYQAGKKLAAAKIAQESGGGQTPTGYNQGSGGTAPTSFNQSSGNIGGAPPTDLRCKSGGTAPTGFDTNLNNPARNSYGNVFNGVNLTTGEQVGGGLPQQQTNSQYGTNYNNGFNNGFGLPWANQPQQQTSYNQSWGLDGTGSAQNANTSATYSNPYQQGYPTTAGYSNTGQQQPIAGYGVGYGSPTQPMQMGGYGNPYQQQPVAGYGNPYQQQSYPGLYSQANYPSTQWGGASSCPVCQQSLGSGMLPSQYDPNSGLNGGNSLTINAYGPVDININ